MTDGEIPAVQMDAEKNKAAYQDWVVDGIKGVDGTRIGTGKYLFTVTTGTIGLFVSIANFASASLDMMMGIGLIVLLVASGLSIRLIIPVMHETLPSANLEAAHKAHIDNTVSIIWVWALGWLTGTAIGILSLYLQTAQEREPSPPMKIQIVPLESP